LICRAVAYADYTPIISPFDIYLFFFAMLSIFSFIYDD